MEPEPIEPEPAPVLTITIDLIPQEGDRHYVRVSAPTEKRLIVVGMLEEAKRMVQSMQPEQ